MGSALFKKIMRERNDKLRDAITKELNLPPDLSWSEVRREIYPGKTLQEIWDSLWAGPVDVDEYLEGLRERTMRDEIKQNFIKLLDSIDDVRKVEYKPGMVFIFKVSGVRSHAKLDMHDQIDRALLFTFGQKIPFLLLNDMELGIVEAEAVLDQSIADQIHE